MFTARCDHKACMMIAIVSFIIFLVGNVSIGIVNFFIISNRNKQLRAFRKEKLDREIINVKKSISDDINSMPLDELVKRE